MRRKITKHLIVCTTLVSGLSVAQDAGADLPRRGYFGVGLEQSEVGVRVFSVAPGSTAASAGIEVGDVIVTIDRHAVDTPAAVVAAIGSHLSGDSILMDVRREDDVRAIDAVLKEYPREQMVNSTVRYGVVKGPQRVRLRTIVSVPKSPPGERFPAVLLIQGGGCGSIDMPIGPPVAQPGLMHGIGAQGFVTMRVEKSGVGDSEGPPCAEIGYEEELAGYQVALAALQRHPSVDPEQIYLLGISLGGVFAPQLAEETHVAGIIVWGTLANAPPPYPGRSERFFAEFATADVAEAWRNVDTRVLILHGEYDTGDQVNRAAGERIAEFVNESSRGAAEFEELAGLDHCWSHHPSMEASVDRCGQGEPSEALLESILGFLGVR